LRGARATKQSRILSLNRIFVAHVPEAALLSGRNRPAAGERVAVLLCGANATAVRFEN
jgi:hypothetical protein